MSRLAAWPGPGPGEAWWVLMVSGLAGMLIGACRYATWQVAVETAQVLAGIVRYPVDNPVYMYHTKLWTVLHQLSALLLRASISERAVSIALSGMVCMVTFQALALTCFALCRSRWLATLVPFLVLFTHGHIVPGVVYPIMLTGTSHTYGALGLSLILLVPALFASGLETVALFLLGIVLCIHPSLGAWCLGVFAVCVLWDGRWLWQRRWTLLGPFACGLALTLLSLLVQMTVIQDVPPIDADTAATYFWAFQRHWDGHRRVFSLLQGPVLLWAVQFAVSLAVLIFQRSALPRPARFLHRYLVVSGGVGMIASVVFWLPPALAPRLLVVLMPTRMPNVGILALLPVLAGMAWKGRARADVEQWPTLPLFCGLVLAMIVLTPFGGVRYGGRIGLVCLTAGGLVVGSATCFRGRRHGPKAWSPVVLATTRLLTWIVMGSLAALMLGWTAIAQIRAWTTVGPSHRLLDGSNDRFLAEVSQRSGMLLTCSDMHLVQLRTRRPVLLDGSALDGLAYTPEAAPATDRILKEVYGIELLSPPPETKWAGAIPNRLDKHLWEQRSAQQWSEIRSKFGVTDVLTYADYRLQLPLVAYTREAALYQIPVPDEPQR